MNRLAVGHLNISSLSNKFGTLQLLLKNSLGIFMVFKTMFGKKKFMDVFTPQYRIDRNANGGGMALYVRENKLSRQISVKMIVII